MIFFHQEIDEYLLPCLNKQMFGIECPGCGIQRSFVLLVKGDFVGAFHMYPAIYTLILLGILLILGKRLRLPKRRTILYSLTAVNVVIIVTSYLHKMHVF